MNIFFAWQGGDGGDFVMQMIYWLMGGEKPNVNKDGKQDITRSVKNFKVNSHRFIKCHVPWQDQYFLNTKDKKLILLDNIDPIIWAKKRVIKLASEKHLQVTGRRSLDKKILKALNEKNIRTAYYWSASYWINCHKHYRKDIQHTLDKTEHIVIENNMVTLDEVTDTVQSVMRCLDLDDTLSTDVQTEIKKYVRKQQYIIDTHWDFVL